MHTYYLHACMFYMHIYVLIHIVPTSIIPSVICTC